MSRSAATLSCSIARCVSVPGPDEPYESLPGFALTYATNSLQRPHRQRRRHDQDVRRAADHRDRREVLDRVVGKLAHRRIGAVRADVADHQRVAVGRGARGGERCDDAAAAALVLDDDRLAEHLAQPLGDGARDEIDAAARLHRRDDLDRLARISGLCKRGHSEPGCGGSAGELEESAFSSLHAMAIGQGLGELRAVPQPIFSKFSSKT